MGRIHEQKDPNGDKNMLRQKALSLYEDISKGSPATGDTKPFTASKGCLQYFERENTFT